MQCQYINHQNLDLSESPNLLDLANAKPIHFQTHFAGCMEMYSDAETVAAYLAAHEGWFCRCAEPMKTQPLGKDGYIMIIGQYGAFGYDVEPKMGVILEPTQDGKKYYMHSIPLPDEPYLGYEVDYMSQMELKEVPREQAAKGIEQIYQKHGISELPKVITQVQWQLDLEVAVKFPKFIRKLPLSLIQKTGDRVLTEIVRQVSPRLTLKVQKDFHSSHQLPLPPKEGRLFQSISVEQEQAA